jgi:hypothetical protein
LGISVSPEGGPAPDDRKEFPMKAAMRTTKHVPAEDLERRETFDLISADKVEGTAVYNRAGDKLGTIDRRPRRLRRDVLRRLPRHG